MNTNLTYQTGFVNALVGYASDDHDPERGPHEREELLHGRQAQAGRKAKDAKIDRRIRAGHEPHGERVKEENVRKRQCRGRLAQPHAEGASFDPMKPVKIEGHGALRTRLIVPR